MLKASLGKKVFMIAYTFLFQLIVSSCALIIILLSLRWLIKKFKLGREWMLLTSLPTMLFFVGFMMRLQPEKFISDEGFFFTEISFVVIYTLFTISFLLGQIKYHKVMSN